MYQEFAWIYDECMDNVPYDKWAEWIVGLLSMHGIRDGIVGDLGCGTGEMTMRLAKAGFDMIGIDLSEDMLEIARDKMYDEELEGILYLHQNLTELELYGTVQALVSVCDTFNYLLEYEELVQVFTLVNNYLEKNGLFVFDMKTPFYYEQVLRDETRVEHIEEGTMIWENSYDAAERLNTYDLTMYLDNQKGAYERYEETHCQRAYSIRRVIEALSEAGMEFIGAYDDYTHEAAGEQSCRVVFVAREGFQPNKKYTTEER